MSDSEQNPTHTEAPYNASYYSTLLASLIHKLNNVTTVLTGNSGLMLMDGKLPRDTRESLEYMTTAIEQLCRVLNEAAIACKGSKLNLGTIDLATLISAMESPIEIELIQTALTVVEMTFCKDSPKNVVAFWALRDKLLKASKEATSGRS